MDILALKVIGVLISILVFAVKAGIGCGCSTIHKRDILLIASSYLVMATIIGIILTRVDISYLMEISSAGIAIHALMALLLIGVGVYTSKNWHSGKDVSHRTFALLSIPCPVCLAALFISIMLLGSSLETSTAILGFAVGIVFFAAVIVSSLTLRKLEKGPDTLGNIMTFLGIFYMLGAIIAPAYMKTKQMGLPEFVGPEVELFPFVGFALLITIGFGLNRLKTQS
ncbi:putative transporter [Methanohalophilus levihalophilus]|uniref:DUF2162 domain-containing protein n=1 Tax=Methanohalophilus levihalophilus TaxID=1431282 RepID=UPI001AE4D3A1|nr:DUF2162 domain-containing protein [Methanohalophilus levihalophilus]MBP2031192.1 putative transporter [Methanohalophilus levihalophilus]